MRSGAGSERRAPIEVLTATHEHRRQRGFIHVAKPSSRPKRSKKVVEAEGVAHIKATFNNTVITITDNAGQRDRLGQRRQGRLQGIEEVDALRGRRSPASRSAVRRSSMGVKRVDVRVQGPGSGRESAIQALAAAGLMIKSILDVTPLPHNGCRPPKKRQGLTGTRRDMSSLYGTRLQALPPRRPEALA